MSTNQQNFWQRTKIFAGSLTYRSVEALQRRLNRRKWLVGATAVVLFSLSFTDWSAGNLSGNDIEAPASLLGSVLNKGKDEMIIEKGPAVQTEYLGSGGPMLSQNDSWISNPGMMDLSADDEDEGADFCLLQDNSFIAPLLPDPDEYFGDCRTEVSTYAVQSGDTPESIALAHKINTDTLLWANDLKETSIIKPGQELTILPINGVKLTVKTGDTIEALAKKYSADAKEIISYNSLPADGRLQVGDPLILPGGEMPAPVSAPKASSYSAPKFAQQTVSSGWLILPTTGYNWGRLHNYNAVDIANKCGTPIYAAAAGEIVLADGVGWNGGYGKYIKISHSNGVITLYAHMTQLVAAGGAVKQGQLIGYMGTTGRSTGCHLHFEVRGATNPFLGR